MKITLSPTIKLNQYTYKKNEKVLSFRNASNVSLEGLNSISNYNIPFCARAVYEFDYDGNWKKFGSAIQASSEETKSTVYRCLRKKSYLTNGKAYEYADLVEDENGKLKYDVVQKILSNFRHEVESPIYAIDLDGNVQKFANAKEIKEKLQIYKSDVYNCMNGKANIAKGHVFAKAFDVELRNKQGKLIRDKNNQPIVDIDMLNKLRENLINVWKNFPCVAIDANGDITQYKNQEDVANALNCDLKKVRRAIQCRQRLEWQTLVLPLRDVVLLDEAGDVIYDEDNNWLLDYDKIEHFRKEAFENSKKPPKSKIKV